MITRVLVANRGEIARRVFRTCRDLGIGTVAVYSDADADSPHRREADRAVRLPGAAPADTYLRADLLIEAARTSGADAIHPGYGFLSENAEFAQAVLDAGLSWIGPPPAAIAAMGSKVEAKHLMADAGVPVLPELDPSAVTERDLPVLVKASAGGGGRGMRIVRTLAALHGEIAAARAEAQSAFGDPTVFCEPYVEAGRHLEVQVLADAHGTVWSLGERECSLQRRHQKVVEETPSPMVDDALRAELSAAAVAAAKAIDYVGAGTVEFLAQNDGSFWFLETNTRLQVEHPVTECVTGLDLVAEQLRIAAGERLAAEPPAARGAAIEVRLYAEDPAQGWRPAAGVVRRFAVPGVRAEFEVPDRPGIRLDAGVVDGTPVGTAYDPMLAKVIAWAPTRVEAAARLAAVLAGARVHGPPTNRDLLVRGLRHPEFLAGRTDTAFFDRIGLDVLAAPLAGPAEVHLAALAAALAGAAARRQAARVQGGLPSGWRNVPSQPQRAAFEVAGETLEVGYRHTGDGLVVEGRDDVTLVSASPAEVVLEVAGVEHRLRAFGTESGEVVDVDGDGWATTLRVLPRFPDAATTVAEGSLVAPMPGTVTAVHVAAGEPVAAGQPLLVLEAMKMQHPVVAPAAGVLRSLDVVAGAQVEAGAVLAVIEAGER
ncbi:acetyl/propionyl/methylcrotonyl-CoA carboxylase subunit alpha [Blastococcus sp. PRF04-17]|uniref:acetyl/propionyl/methylcrotonyl-CoA carboxylase subunit alpha n=1 Tax=Blastococcus sp. PRF04-17 TaxID=2933797 RepID=UPI001FF19849|nr:biotin carboxylase N-terminal domain-containing protein [Blastococcus sp. PRF04-17]UOY00780.1 ATP-grasp domain-containing protein [Blastococcus sp. PRF04-17]